MRCKPTQKGPSHSLLTVKSFVVFQIARCTESTGKLQPLSISTVTLLSRSKKVHQSRHFRVLGRKSAGGTKPNGPQGGWVC